MIYLSGKGGAAVRVTFLDHSAFLVELPSVALLFDWQKGSLPPLPDGKPLLVFASHGHDDHFSPGIFSLPAAAFLLGADIVLGPRQRDAWGVSPLTAAKCTRFAGGETRAILPGVTVEALPSTDEGVAFLVTADGKTVYHAGDLNWWHWDGEPDPWNPEMAEKFKAYTAPLAGRTMDLALLPLDPRQGRSGFLGARHLLETTDIRRFIPMHQWGDFAFTDAFLAAHPQFAAKTTPLRRPGKVFDL